MTGYLLVTAGAAIGGPLRYLVDRIVQSRHRAAFPWGTLTVNVVGSAVFGALTAALLARASSRLDLLVGTGFCGAFTTYSTFCYETVRLWQRTPRWYALANAAGGIATGLLASGTGFFVMWMAVC